MAVSLFLSACSISQEPLTKFGEATEKTVGVLAAASKAEAEMRLDASVAHQSCNYLQGQPFTLGGSIQKGSDLLKGQAGVARALTAYAKALQEATDAEGVKALQEAGDGFVSSLAEDLELAAAPEVGVVLNAVILLSEAQRIREIKMVMARVQASLLALEVRVKEDAQEVDRLLIAAQSRWEQSARCVLSASRRTGSSSDGLFREYDAVKRQWQAERKKASQALNAVSSLIAAHAAVLADDGDFDAGLANLNNFLESVETAKEN
ncbi:MAG: hypothetical protein NXI27_30650 [Alphaproteobacteria bacterium]|nr:hypothetical protein [Alphaproteobacteria bacterium]